MMSTKKGLTHPTHHHLKDTSSMGTKEGLKRPQGSRITAHPLHPYEELRLRQCMRNSARLQQLGIPSSSSIFPSSTCNAQNKKKPNHGNNEDSGSDYDPSQDDTVEEDSVRDDNAKHGSKEKTCKITNKESENSTRTVAGVRFRSRKRVYAAEVQPGRATRSKTSIAQPDAILTPSNIQLPPLSQPNDGTQTALQDDELAHLAENNHMTNGGDAIPCPDGLNNMDNEDASAQHDNNIVGDGGDCMTTRDLDASAQHDNNQMTSEGVEARDRGLNMGHGLQRLTRSRGAKLPIVINEGNIRPLVPMIAAKFATECNIVVRSKIPILRHWKDYKRQPALIQHFLGSLSAKFDINTRDPTIKNGCLEMMKSAVRQQRHKLKKEFFDPFSLHLVTKTSPVKVMNDKQWLDLVESWKTPKKMVACQKNKDNRANVKFHQTTGSSSYEVLVENLGDEFKDKEPDAFDLFKICHYSKKKKAYTPTVQSAIAEMENQLAAPTDGGQPNSATEVVAVVLDKNTKNNHFLQNVGLRIAKRRSNLQDVQAQLDVERRANAELQSIVNNQTEAMDDLAK